MRTQNLLGRDFCQNQASEIYFDPLGFELRQPPKTFCYGSLHQNKTLPYVSRILTVRLPYTMYVDAKSTRCWKYSPGDPKSLFSPGSTFQPNRDAVSTGLGFFSILCTQPEPTLPTLIENNKNHQITLPKGRIGFSSLDVADREEPKHQIRNPYELTSAKITTDDKYNDCFLLHLLILAQSPDDCLKNFTVPRFQNCNNYTPSDIASQQMLRWARYSPTFIHNVFPDFEMHTDGQNCWQDKLCHSGTELAIDISTT